RARPSLVERYVTALHAELGKTAREHVEELVHVFRRNERLADASQGQRSVAIEHALMCLRALGGVANEDASLVPQVFGEKAALAVAERMQHHPAHHRDGLFPT